ncbi:MAG: GGDEF domain-containing protein, partial [bacterium]
MKAGLKAFTVGLGALLLVLGLGLGLGFPGTCWALAGLVLLGPMVLFLGFGLGPWAGMSLGFAALVFTACLGARGNLPADGIAAALALECAGILFPRVLAEVGRGEERLFTEQHGPVAAERDALRADLERLRNRAAQVEREGRETDAMFHVGREIGKLLTLADTLEFTHEILHDTLKQPGSTVEPVFVVALVEEGRSAMRIEVVEGLQESEAEILGSERGDNAFYRWLHGSLNPVLVRSIAAESALKGSALPAGARGLLSVPLIAEGRAIGWVLVFDMGAGSMSDEEASNLGILCSQLAIGLEKALLYDRLQRLSVTDGLTGLTVHRHFQSRLDEELKRSERYHEPLSLIMADIDHFKRFNDTWGHLV